MAFARARGVVSFGGILLGLGLTQPGAADVPPQHGFVDSCSVSNQEDANTRCEPCIGTGDTLETCREELQARGYTLGCRAHARPEEVWCSKAAATKRSPWLAVFAVAGLLGVALLLKRTLRRPAKR